MTRLQRFATPWLWPRVVHAEAEWTRRLGRVIHWTSAFCAALAFGFGVYLAALTYTNHVRYSREIAEWNKRQAVDPYAGIAVPVEHGPSEEHAENKGGRANPFDQFDDSKPFPVDAEPQLALWGAIAAFLTLLFGRTARYVIAGE